MNHGKTVHENPAVAKKTLGPYSQSNFKCQLCQTKQVFFGPPEGQLSQSSATFSLMAETMET